MLDADAIRVREDDSVSGKAAPPAPLRRIALIGNALPRKCGLATFTSHLAEALALRYPTMSLDHYAMDDGSGVAYPGAIRTIAADDRAAYREAARAIERSGAEALWLQHEYGIFGGEAGAHVLDLLDETSLPVAITLHTILESPSPAERHVFERLLARAQTLIVMASSGADILQRRFGIARDRILVIPHGVPDRAMIAADRHKPRFDVADRTVLMTFGLLAPDKGIERMIDAMPAIAARHPEALYLVVGATHPNLLRSGDDYRRSLEQRVEALGLGDHVRFDNRFVEQEELLDLLQASDVYVTPYLNLAQVTSGTLSYAAAVGKPIVATPYVHARELLAESRGVLVEPGSSESLAAAIIDLLDRPGRREAIARSIYRHSRGMLWSKVAERAVEAIAERKVETPRPSARSVPTDRPLPLTAIQRMTDSTGMFQHSRYGVPDRNHGYCIDDNARALLLMALRDDGTDPEVVRLARIYAAFVEHGWNRDIGRFRNFMSFDRRWLEESGSEDSNGRTLWALGVAATQAHDRPIREWARDLYDQATKSMAPLESPRAQALAALGGAAIVKHEPAHAASLELLDNAGRTLERLHRTAQRPDWDWYENVLAYDNARLCEAQIRAGQLLGRPEWIVTALGALRWLYAIQRGPRGQLRPVGSESFRKPFELPARFDQQPIEAQAMVDAARAAFEATGDMRWVDTGRRAFGWFAGDNDAGLMIAIPDEGSCFDGLMRHGVNRNQGAESILALHLAAAGVGALSLAAKATTRAPVLAD